MGLPRELDANYWAERKAKERADEIEAGIVENPCPDCGHELDYLDTVRNKSTSAEYTLYICHNEDCVAYGHIWNDADAQLLPGDPAGLY